MKQNLDVQILVTGNGPVGMTAALAFASEGCKVALIGPPRRNPDLRTTALMLPAIGLLQRLGVWDHVRPHAAPLKTMRIIDGTKRLVRALPVTFQASEIGEPAFGWNMPNEVLLEALESQVRSSPAITRVDAMATAFVAGKSEVTCTLDNSEAVCAPLVVAADGRNSIARQAAGIDVRTWSYPQVAMVLSFAHGHAHDGISTEFHTETGPFTIVPLPGDRSSLVWVLAPSAVGAMKSLSDAELALEIERKMQSILGKIIVDTPRQFYPLSGQTPERFAARRTMLVGEAAHVFPPIGAQGLNLGLRDVAECVSAAKLSLDDPGSDAAIRSYDSARRADIMLRTGAVDMLNRSLLSAFLPVQVARSLGLGMLSAVPPLRDLFMREGMQPGSGFRALLQRGKAAPP